MLSDPNPPQLPLTSFPNLKYTQPYFSGALTPLHTSASIPFSWEQEPGKPLPCLTLALPSHHNDIIKSLDLPPRLLNETKCTKTPSPTTVLEGPYNALGRSILGSTSFRFLRKRRKSFDGELCFVGSRGDSPERSLLSSVVGNNNGKKSKGLFGSWRKKSGSKYCKSEVCEDSFVFSSFSDDGIGGFCDGGNKSVNVGSVYKKSNQQLGLSQSKSHFWATIYGTLKQVIPRRSTTKCKKDAL